MPGKQFFLENTNGFDSISTKYDENQKFLLLLNLNIKAHRQEPRAFRPIIRY